VKQDALDSDAEPEVMLLDWEIDIVDEGETIGASLDEIEDIPAGDQIAVAGDAPAGQYLYVLAIADVTHQVTVLYDSGTPLANGGPVRVPATGWITLPATGTIRVAAAAEPVAADEWAELLGQRDPPPSLPKDPQS
jgi:hypothetical protein